MANTPKYYIVEASALPEVFPTGDDQENEYQQIPDRFIKESRHMPRCFGRRAFRHYSLTRWAMIQT